MNVSAPFIARPIATMLLAIGLMIGGLIAYGVLPVAPLPNVDFPVVAVLAARPGADPETMANSIAAPLERRLGEIPGVSELTSTSTVGNATIIVAFDVDRNIDDAARDVQAAINAAATDLPTDLPTRPHYRKFNPNDLPVLQVALTSKIRSTAEVYDAVDTILAQRLSQIEGVAQVQINGAEQPAVRIQIDPVRAAAAGINPQDVYTAVRNANVTEATGGLQTGSRAIGISTNGQISQAEDYAPLIVKTTKAGAIVRVRDIATVVNATSNSRLAAWSGRDPAILLSVTKLADANVIDTVDRVLAALPQVMRWLPPDIEATVIQDRTTTIRASVSGTQWTLLATIGLVLAVVAVFMRRVGSTIAAAVTVPLSLAGTLAGMWFFGFTLDNFSLMALTISVGFVVDDAIVMIENIARLRATGLSPMRAALAGSRQIGFTVISISVSLVAVFIPILFMGGILGKLLNEFAITLTLAIVCSAAVSLTITPMICARLMPNEGAPPGWLGRADRGLDRAFAWLAERYVATLAWVMRDWVGMTAMILILPLTLVMIVQLATTASRGFVPIQDTGLLMGQTIASPDISFAAMVERQQRAVDILLRDPDVAAIGSTVGVATGWSSPNRGTLSITLRANRRATAEEVIQRLRAPLAAVGGLQTFLFSAQDLRGAGSGGSGGSQFQFTVTSSDLDAMRRATLAIEERLRAESGISDINSDQDRAGPQITVRIDRDAAARLGVTVAGVDNTLNNALSQRQITTIYTDRNEYRVVLEATPALQTGPSGLDSLYVAGRNNHQIPLSAIARFVRDDAPLQVRHTAGFPSGNIFFNTPPGTSLGDATKLIDRVVASMSLPGDVHVAFAGNAKFLAQSLDNEPILIGAMFLSIFIVLGVLYESLLHPLTIISTLFSGVLGGLLALRLAGLELDIIGIIGIVLLLGIVKKNGIMLVDFALEQERDHGLGPRDAILQACRERFRPILMTTLAALLGALPLAFSFGVGSELRRPLGVCISGGLIVSQFLTLYTTPAIYLALEQLARGKRTRAVIPPPATAPAE